MRCSRRSSLEPCQGREKQEKGGRRPLLSCHLRAREPSTAVPRPRRQIKYCKSASGLAAHQPRKPKAAHRVNWFYVASSFSLFSPFAGDCVTCFGKRHLNNVFPYHCRLHYAPETRRCQPVEAGSVSPAGPPKHNSRRRTSNSNRSSASPTNRACSCLRSCW
jgi:hypothetical protein